MSTERYVIGLDSSTQSAKAVVLDRKGCNVAEGRASIPLAQPDEAHAEQNPEDWWSAVKNALRDAVKTIDPGSIDGLAISNQRETVAFLDDKDTAVYPALVWLDCRANSTYQSYADRMGREWLHRATGKPIDVIPVIYRLDWLRRNEPSVLERATQILDVQGFLVKKLTGRAVTSPASVDPFGLLDIHEMDYSTPILNSLGLSQEQLAPMAMSGREIGRVSPEAAKKTGLRAGTPIFAGGGDGQCSGLGANVTGPGNLYLNLGTAQITGAHSQEPAIGLNWRTMTAVTGSGYHLEALMRAGAFFVDWLVETFIDESKSPEVYIRLEAEAEKISHGCGGLTVTPHILGVMTPHWDPGARGAFAGLAPFHTRAHLYRASLEGMTAEIARSITAMRAENVPTDRIRAIGGGSKSALWRQMIADATQLPVDIGTTAEASALGAGIIAAVGAGWFVDFAEATAAMSHVEGTTEPEPEGADAWAALMERQGHLYEDTKRYGAGRT
ncbi:xylulokinase protein [Fulvimarina pelagi HTCC2506]|uniref:Xylulokinase protein n=1 Tax=Fulvimarina pelagi HTCC2506 TaxID=314231 RepID=Q0FXF6_9HYPH|nr:FGGY-family carbohydrate kinase [Fulvimarina pelagi]EAU39694.1 xylulokinase protein [Fulvimarina pelagi HTCC2506]